MVKREFCLFACESGKQRAAWLMVIIDLKVSHRVMVIKILGKKDISEGEEREGKDSLEDTHMQVAGDGGEIC